MWEDLGTLIATALGVGSVIATCVWCVAQIKGAISSVSLTATHTASLLGKDIQHLSNTILELKTEVMGIKTENNLLLSRVGKLEFLSEAHNKKDSNPR